MEIKNTGVVEKISDGIVVATGLSKVGYGEIVNIVAQKKTLKGLVLNLEKDKVGIVVMGEFKEIKAGDLVEVTNDLPSIEVCDELLGRVLNGIGNPIDGSELKLSTKKVKMPFERIAPGVIERKDVERPLHTGVMAIDAMTPIGRGQRQLIIGDRQTGKSTIGIDTILNQKDENVVCIYVAIGQKSSKIAQLVADLEARDALKYTIILLANSSDDAAMQFFAPYTGTAIAEYFAEQGKDALIIYDDLSKHAYAYREIALLLERPPGREAYPGDIFYLHSRLLERSVQYSDAKGGGSITSLPVVETQAADLSTYIPTNIISITDGQIYLEADLFNANHRPAINVGLSVSRVGGAAQTKPMKQVSGQLRLDLAQYRALEAFAQLGTDLDSATQMQLDRGARMTELLKQDQYNPIPIKEQILLIYAGTNGFLDEIEVKNVTEWKNALRKHLVNKHKDLLDSIELNKKIEGEIEEQIKKVISGFSL
ncbi:F0F1 ATP synthase subunit alpha [Candidatus Dojkabacteria bacterium]|nr:F0F1 ATP synthase subunit alpha [Candidatus Dojkabacteria bacterium]